MQSVDFQCSFVLVLRLRRLRGPADPGDEHETNSCSWRFEDHDFHSIYEHECRYTCGVWYLQTADWLTLKILITVTSSTIFPNIDIINNIFPKQNDISFVPKIIFFFLVWMHPILTVRERLSWIRLQFWFWFTLGRKAPYAFNSDSASDYVASGSTIFLKMSLYNFMLEGFDTKSLCTVGQMEPWSTSPTPTPGHLINSHA